jgi:molybdate transport system substrate-binding protein
MAGSGIKVLSAGAVKRGVTRIAADFERATGTRVTVDFATGPELRKRVAAGEPADVIVAPPAIMDEFAKQGKIVADSRAFVGRSRMGIVVHADAPTPALGNTAGFKKLLLGAAAVVYNQASSGLYAAKLMEQLGLAQALGSRIIVVGNGADVMEYVAEHPSAAVGLGQISEVMVHIDKGLPIKLAGPMPAEIQNETSYDAAATASSAAHDVARGLAHAPTSPAAKRVFAATGIS